MFSRPRRAIARRSITRWCGFALAVSLIGLPGRADDAGQPPLDVVLPVLIRDSGVRRELGLSDDDTRAIDSLLDEWNERLFGLRMLSPVDDAAKVETVLSGFRGGLQDILTTQQQARLKGLSLQSNGWRSLTDPSIAADLNLSAAQRKQIDAVLRQTVNAATLERDVTKNGDAKSLQRAAERLRLEEHARIEKALTPAQKRKWLALVGPKYDLTTVRQSAGRAPEVRGISEWVNSDPRTLAELRGRVVVLHFLAADCINCVRNLPHYQAWHERFSDRDVTVLGIHSPETSAERDAKHVRQKLAGHGVTYPVALDAEMQTWNAWTNRMWPSTYLIDKRGEIRFWWYGELQWQGAEGESWMRQRIEQLLAEE